MAGGGGSKSQTTTQSSEPWKAAQPALKTGLDDAMKLYKSGVGSQPFTGSTVVPYAQQTIQGMNQVQGSANSSLPAFQQNFGQVAANASNGGLNALQEQSVRNLRPFANTNPVEGTGQLNDIQRNALNMLNPIAGGSEMQGNPYLNDVINRSAEDIGKSSNLMASAAGRYGSGGHQGVIADAVGDMASGLRFADYGNQQARRDAAIRDVFGMGGQANNQYEADMARKMDAIGSTFNAGQQQQQNINANAGALSDAFQALQAPSSALMGIGGMYEDLQGRQLNDTLRIFNEKQNQGWNQIGRLQGVASGAGTMGSTGQATAQGPSRAGAGLGGALSGYAMTGGNPLGALLGGAGGYFL